MTKKTLLSFLLILLLLATASAQASGGSFSVSMSIRDIEGDTLYDDAPLLPAKLAEGLTVEIENCDRNSCDVELLAVYRGQLLPFRVEGGEENVWQHPLSLARGEKAVLHICFEEEMLSQVLQDDNYLSFVAVEAVDVQLPSPEIRELITPSESASKWVSRTMGGEEPARYKELSPEEQMNRPAFPTVTIAALDGVKTDGSSYQKVSSTSPEITYTITDCWVEHYLSDEKYGEVVVIPMVNGQLCLQDGRPLTCSAFGSGETVEGTMTLPLEAGENQVSFLLWQVSDTGWPNSYFAQRYVIDVEE